MSSLQTLFGLNMAMMMAKVLLGALGYPSFSYAGRKLFS